MNVPGPQWTYAISASEDAVDTNLVRRWLDSAQYQHFFGTITVIVRLDCNLTSVLGKLEAKRSVRVSRYPMRMGRKKKMIVIRKYIAAEMA